MARSLLLLAGAMAGGAAVYLLQAGSPPVDHVGAPALPEAASPPVTPATSLETTGTRAYASERLAIYEQAAQATDNFDVESLIEIALDDPPSRLRDLKLTALLARFAELDPERAVAFARNRYIEPRYFIPLFEAWAASDPAAAIGELALLSPPALQRELALAILEVIGNDAEGVELVAAALPAVDRVSFEVDAMAERIAANPAGALDAYLALPNSLYRTMMLPHIAEIAAGSDPLAALAGASAINDYSVRQQFTDAVVIAWANLDPDATFEWLQSAAVEDLPQTLALYQVLAASDSARLLAMLDSLPGTVRTNAQRAAMQGIAEQDPAGALAMLDSMPPGADRDSLLQTVAMAYARQSPDDALAWARSLPPAQSQAAVTSVLRGIAATDPIGAIDRLLVEIENGPGPPNPLTAFSTGFTSSPSSVLTSIVTTLAIYGGDFAPIVDRLLTSDNSQVQAMLTTTVSAWARQDGDAAVSWALRNTDRLAPSAFATMAGSVASTDLDGAMAILDRLPAEQRMHWAEGVVLRLAASDQQRAINMLESIRGQPGYEDVYAAAAMSMATSDPVRAAGLLRSLPESASAQTFAAVSRVARELTSTDPAAAVELALGVRDPNMRQAAISQIASGWAANNPSAALEWVRSLNTGPERDRALDSYLSATAAGQFDPVLLDAYSTPEAREQGAGRAIMEIGKSNLPEARRLLDRYVTNDALRRQIEASLARTGGVGASGSFVPPPLPVRQD